MKLGFTLVLFIIILNLVSGLIYTLGVAGTEYTYGTSGTGNATEYEDRFNPETMMNNTQPNVIADFPYLGNVYAGITTLWNGINFVIMGFPSLLEQFASYLPTTVARNAYSAITLTLRAVFFFVIFGWLFQVVTGRTTQD